VSALLLQNIGADSCWANIVFMVLIINNGSELFPPWYIASFFKAVQLKIQWLHERNLKSRDFTFGNKFYNTLGLVKKELI
jgi:hypothetical protein